MPPQKFDQTPNNQPTVSELLEIIEKNRGPVSPLDLHEIAAKRNLSGHYTVPREEAVRDSKEAREVELRQEQRMKAEGVLDAYRKSTLFEFLFIQNGERYNWTGLNSHVMNSNKYDDINNHTDGFMLWRTEENNEFADQTGIEYTSYPVSFDTTFSTAKMESKVSDIVKRISNDSLSVKYFFPYKTTAEETISYKFEGMADEIKPAHFVLPISEKAVSIFENILSSEQNQEADQKTRDAQTIFLKYGYVQFQVISAMIEQCEVFIEIAKKNGNKVAADRYEEAEDYLVQARAERMQNRPTSGEIEIASTVLGVPKSYFDITHRDDLYKTFMSVLEANT